MGRVVQCATCGAENHARRGDHATFTCNSCGIRQSLPPMPIAEGRCEGCGRPFPRKADPHAAMVERAIRAAAKDADGWTTTGDVWRAYRKLPHIEKPLRSQEGLRGVIHRLKARKKVSTRKEYRGRDGLTTLIRLIAGDRTRRVPA